MYILKDYYPRPHSNKVFAIRTFNEDWHETGYYCHDIGMKYAVTFETPRAWGERELFLIKLANNKV